MEETTQVIRSIKSGALDGFDSFVVDIEASFTKGLPNFSIVGMTDESIKESKERIKSALLLNDFIFAPLRITVSLAPSDKAKKGSHFDLPVAVLLALKDEQCLDEFFCFGELGLDGKVRSTESIFAIVLSLAIRLKNIKVVVPIELAPKIAMIVGVEAYGVSSLKEAVEFFAGDIKQEPIQNSSLDFPSLNLDKTYYFLQDYPLDFKEIKGQTQAIRAALICATGFHNILFIGSPGSGKSMISKRLRYVLPPMSLDDILFCAKIDSLQNDSFKLLPLRPFRSPHHTATKSSIFGGGTKGASIGEIALASRGELFLDELPHFAKTSLEAMREPLEDKKMLISRVNSKIEYETDFLFCAAMNPCACGNLLNPDKPCTCSELELSRYKSKLSEPFLDRLDLFVYMNKTNLKEKVVTSSKDMHELVLKAFSFAKKRNQAEFNARIKDADLDKFAPLAQDAKLTLDQAATSFSLSARSQGKIRRVARTIADLDNSEVITKPHILEALFYRKRS